MAVARRLTIGGLMMVVLLVAVDVAVVRQVWRIKHPVNWSGICLTTLPMVNALLLAAPKLRGPSLARWSWGGFEAAGWLGVVGLGVAIHAAPDLAFWPIRRLEHLLPVMAEARKAAILIPAFVAIYSSPLLLLGLAGGLLLAIVRSARSGPGEE